MNGQPTGCSSVWLRTWRMGSASYCCGLYSMRLTVVSAAPRGSCPGACRRGGARAAGHEARRGAGGAAGADAGGARRAAAGVYVRQFQVYRSIV